MGKITVVATIVAKPDAIEPVKAELLKMVPLTRQEPGCLEYRLHQDSQNPALFVFYENWECLAALEEHMTSAHFQCYVAAVVSLLAEKVVYKMTELA
jgi:quinol monooxygenase YgiN